MQLFLSEGTSMTLSFQSRSTKSITLWLFALSLALWGMIMLGGYTRLTHSGLSIVDWKPITGIIPPLTQSDWVTAFQDYQLFPEFKSVNFSMTLDEFRQIYLIEYFHRVLGRFIGVLFFVPFIYFLAKKLMPSFLKWRLGFVFLLGGAQGVMGWYMVKSGLIDKPEVSHLRLTAHLVLAVVILAVILWSIFQLTDDGNREVLESPKPRRMALLALSSIALTVVYGGFVAGLKAGLIYNTYPLMGNSFLPGEWDFFTPLYRNFLENPALVQFMHRWLGGASLVLTAVTTFLVLKHARSSRLRATAWLFSLSASLQVILGILTLLTQVPVALGTIHQGMAVALFSIGLYLFYQLKPERDFSYPVFLFHPPSFQR